MAISKQPKSHIVTWILVDVAFLIIVIMLLAMFVQTGKEAAAEDGRKELVWQVSKWTDTIEGMVVSAETAAGVFLYSTEKMQDGANYTDLAAHLKGIVDATPFTHVCLFKGPTQLVDENGSSTVAFSTEDIPDEGFGDVKVSVIGPLEGEESPSLAVFVPLGEAPYHLACLISLDELGESFSSFSYTELYFLSIVSPEGDILGVFDKYRDSDSIFLKEPNLINTVMNHTGKDDYYMFKARITGRLSCTIRSKYGSDERTMAFVPFDSGNYYLVMGIRQQYFDMMCETSDAEVIKTTLRLGSVIFIFSAFVIGTLILSSVRHKEEGKVLEDKADTDLLTDLYNKLATERKIQEHIDSHPTERCMLVIFDVDNFKKINDTMGHAFGDLMLKTIGRDVRSVYRTSDIVGRIGGDEFVVFLKNLHDNAEILEQARRLTVFFHDFKAGGDYVKYSASASIGVSIFPEDGKNFKALYEAADQALYRSKERGKARLTFYNEAVYGESIRS